MPVKQRKNITSRHILRLTDHLFRLRLFGFLQKKNMTKHNNIDVCRLLSIATLVMSILLSRSTAQESLRNVYSINDLFAIADSNSKTLKLSALAIAAAEAKVEEAKVDKLPSLSFSASAGYFGNVQIISYEDNLPSGTYPVPHFSNNYGLEASYVLYAGGVMNKNIALSELQNKLTTLQYEKNKQEVRLLLVGHYIDLFVAQNQQEVYRQNIEQTQKLLAMMERRVERGVALRSDVLRTQLQLSSYELALTSVRNKISIVNKKLVETLALPTNTTILTETHIPIATAALSTAGYANNIDLQTAQVQIETAEKALGIAKASNSPVLALYGSSNLARPFMYDLPPLDLYAHIWTAGVTLSYQIDGLYKNKKKIKQAKIHVAESKMARELADEHVDVDYHELKIGYQESMEQLEVAKRDLALAQDNFTLVSNRYNAQLALITDLMDASASKVRAELQVKNAEAAIAFASYRILRLTGEI